MSRLRGRAIATPNSATPTCEGVTLWVSSASPVKVMETIHATTLICVLLAPCVISLSTYNVSLGSREGDHGNTVTATCMDASGTELLDPVWYFNGSEEHHCLRGAVRTNASVTVHIFPDCEGYLQCGTVETLSKSTPLYGNTVVCFSPPFTSFVCY